MRLIAGKGGGSTMIEALLELAQLPYEREELSWEDIYGTSPRLRAINPAGHVPALILDDGSIITESVALALLISEWAPHAKLAPPPGAPDRARFLRLLVMIGASIYPMWTIDDEPSRYVGDDEKAADVLRARVDARRKDLWSILETLVDAQPYALGAELCAIDVFISVMTRWRPRRDWFKADCPKLHAIAERIDALPALKEVWARNYA